MFRENHLLRLDNRSIRQNIALMNDGCREEMLASEPAFGVIETGA